MPEINPPRQNDTSQNLEQLFQENREEILKHATGKEKLLIDPVGYAQGAIVELKRQLKTAKSPKRKTKLEKKISQWELMLSILGDENDSA